MVISFIKTGARILGISSIITTVDYFKDTSVESFNKSLYGNTHVSFGVWVGNTFKRPISINSKMMCMGIGVCYVISTNRLIDKYGSKLVPYKIS